MTSDEQMAAWVEGKNLHRDGGTHGALDCIDPPGRGNRRWRCDDCGAVGTTDNLRRETCPNSKGECVPDFACCRPELAQPLEVRRAFMAAKPAERDRFLYAFLGAAFAGKNVHIAGRQPERD